MSVSIQQAPNAAIGSMPMWTAEQVALVKRTVAKGATDDELQMFLYIAGKYNLDPFTKEIWFIKRVKKVKDAHGNWDYPRLANGEVDYTGAETVIMTSRDGYLKTAMTGSEKESFDGIQSFVVHEGDTFKIDAQHFSVDHQITTKNRGRIIGAWAAAYHKSRKPAICYVEFAEYNEENSPSWKRYPSAMIQKVAETFVLRRQFNISGMVSKEELTIREVEDSVPSTAIAPVRAVAPTQEPPALDPEPFNDDAPVVPQEVPEPSQAPTPQGKPADPPKATANGNKSTRWLRTLESAHNMGYAPDDVLREAKAHFDAPNAEHLDDILVSPGDMTDFVLHLKHLKES